MKHVIGKDAGGSPEVGFFYLITTGQGLFTKVVQFFLRRPNVKKAASHTAGSFLIYGARVVWGVGGSGGAMDSWDHFCKHNEVNAILRPTDGELAVDVTARDVIKELVEKYLDLEYDYWAAGSTATQNRLPWLWSKIKRWARKWFGMKKVHCTEVWKKLLEDHGYQMPAEDADTVDYWDITKVMLQSGEWEITWKQEGFQLPEGR